MNIKIVRCRSNDVAIVQRIYERTPEFFRRTDGSAALPHFAQRDMTDSPAKEKQSPTYEKFFCLILIDDAPVGVVDLHRDHPEKGITYLGLLLIEETHQGKGWGRAAFDEVQEFISANLRSSTLRLGISQNNDVETFWTKMGFAHNGRSYEWRGASCVNQVFEMEKKLL